MKKGAKAAIRTVRNREKSGSLIDKMYQDKVVLCGASAYDKKYYLNEDFAALPEQIQKELQIMCVLFTEEIGGVLTLDFDEDGTLCFEVVANEDDFCFDEIGSALKIKQLQREKQELLEALQLFYKVFFLEENIEELLTEE
nr:DUF6145 family protein [Anaerobium acetethylicum]